MELAELKVELREGSGKGRARRLRMKDRLPGIIYAKGEESVKVQVDPLDIKTAIRTHEGSLPIFSVVGNGKDAEKLSGVVVIVRELQIDPLSRDYIHVDLMKVDLSKQITIEVTLHFIGRAKGLKDGGILDEPIRKLDVKCFPSDIPEFIEVDVTNLDLGESLHIKDIRLPKGCSVDMSVNFTLVSVILPKRGKEGTEEAAEVAAEETAE